MTDQAVYALCMGLQTVICMWLLDGASKAKREAREAANQAERYMKETEKLKASILGLRDKQ